MNQPIIQIAESAYRGRLSALERFKLSSEFGHALGDAADAALHGHTGRLAVQAANAATNPGLLDRLKSFGSGQVGAAKDLFHNLRGGLGGEMNPGLITGPVPPQSMDLARATHRQQALGNVGKLAPSLAAGGLYMWHRRNQEQDEQARRRAMMAQQSYSPPM